MDPMNEAQTNLEALRKNPYPGRGIVVGMDETGKYIIQVCWIMGRSDNSRNRVYDHNYRGHVFTEAADPSKMKDPSLIIYNAMDECGDCYAVSNGKQTDDVVERADIEGLLNVLKAEDYIYEPDKPNFTPRITAITRLDELPHTEIAILAKSRWGDECDRYFYEYDRHFPGLGFCLTTYTSDGNPLPPFRGEPYLLPLIGDWETAADTLWAALDPDNRVALAIKMINIKSGVSEIDITNRFRKVA
jgi:IMP cyclohydrolase-like protein.